MADRQSPRLVLASGSPQRRAILERLGVDFVISPTEVTELQQGEPGQVALENARRKAESAFEQRTGAEREDLVLGVDTLVTLEGRIYGKPADLEEARTTLSALSAVSHEVLSGMALIDADGGQRTALASTTVSFRALDEQLIDWYLAQGEWRGRAGGYAIQGLGATLVREIRGDYENVVGLPVASLLDICPSLLWA